MASTTNTSVRAELIPESVRRDLRALAAEIDPGMWTEELIVERIRWSSILTELCDLDEAGEGPWNQIDDTTTETPA